MQRGAREAELPSRFLARQAFEVTQDQRSAVTFRKACQLLIQNCLNFAPGDFGNRVGLRPRSDFSLTTVAPRVVPLQSDGDAARHAVQPAAQRGALANRRSLS